MSNNTIDDGVHSLSSDILCYAFPFGIMGWITHLVSLYVIAILSLGRRPLRPSQFLDHDRMDAGLSVVGILMSLGVSIPMIVHCRNDKWVTLMAASKTATSVAADLFGLIVSWRCRKARLNRESTRYITGQHIKQPAFNAMLLVTSKAIFLCGC